MGCILSVILQKSALDRSSGAAAVYPRNLSHAKEWSQKTQTVTQRQQL